jgi:hypothetical protein
MSTIFFTRLQATARRQNRRLGWMLALLVVIYIAAVIAFIVAY